MAESESTNNRPKCDWQITQKDADGKTSTRKCDSEERVFVVKGKGLYTGRSRETKVCRRHLEDAMKKWNYDTADPICG